MQTRGTTPISPRVGVVPLEPSKTLSTGGNAAGATAVDGRRERGARNKAAVVTALLDLYEAGEYQPSAARVAEVAGVSERSVFRYFDDMEDLASSAISMQWDRIRHLFEGVDTDGDFANRVESIVDHRLRLYDKVLGVAHASAVAALRSATVATAMEQRRSFLRDQAIKQFQPEIDASKNPEMSARLVDLALCLETWQYFRNSVRLSRAQVRDTAIAALHAALPH